MPNGNAPQGGRPVKDISNRPYNAGCNTYYVTSAHAGSIFTGDPVIITGSADANGVPTVDIASAGATNRITGFVVGFQPDANIVANGYLPASTAGYVIVADDPNDCFELQATTLAAADIGLNANLAAGTGARATGSGWYIDTSGAGSGATLQMRILAISPAADNALGQYCKVLARINLPTEAGIASGVGV